MKQHIRLAAGAAIAAAALGLATLGLAPLASAAAPAQGEAELRPALPDILPLREQATLRDELLRERLDTLLPQLMRQHGVDMWIVLAREYNEDPVITTMLDARNLRARRRTMLVFFDPGEGKPLEKLVVNKHGMNGLYEPAWDMAAQPDQWARLGEIVAERNPARIAINTSHLSAFADGLTHTQYSALMAALPAGMDSRVVSAYPLAIGWLETRTATEAALYGDIVRIAHAIIGEGFSTDVIQPGVTTNEDLVWWYRQRVNNLGLASWFHPSVEITRRGVQGVIREAAAPIQRGDMLRVDFGIVYLGYSTDTQHVAYVLQPGERDAPAGLKAGLLANNRVQDALTDAFKVGRSGNETLRIARENAIAQGLAPTIYTHPIGYHGHGAGASIGLSENQHHVPTGEYPVQPNTAWSIELKAQHAVPEWDGQLVDFKTEEDAFFDGKTVRYVDGRQTRFHLIGGAQ
ncbi:M24 family metallopeptidase [Parahaliea mediterranea]|uniref:M24 family metallopeptidase n=1 Tax=Parahaliea mediterranea TaxID=651086 RepID=UPI000E2F5AB8|nr:M24 family metallopeptidase [Parahaliea mediterranea]